MRSASYPTRYRVGSLDGRDVYWHPQFGYAIEDDQRLVGINDVSQVDWFDQAGDIGRIVCDLRDSNGKLAEAMVGSLYGHILDAIEDEAEDEAFADECEAEKRALLCSGVFHDCTRS